MKKTTSKIAPAASDLPDDAEIMALREREQEQEQEQERQTPQRVFPVPGVDVTKQNLQRKDSNIRPLFPILRKGWLESLQSDPEANAVIQRVFSRDQLQMISAGFTPPGWHVRLQIPQALNGGNSCENFVLVQHGMGSEKAGEVIQLAIDAQGFAEWKAGKPRLAYVPISQNPVCSGAVDLPPVTNNSRLERLTQVMEYLPADAPRSSLLPKPVAPPPTPLDDIPPAPPATPAAARRKTRKLG